MPSTALILEQDQAALSGTNPQSPLIPHSALRIPHFPND